MDTHKRHTDDDAHHVSQSSALTAPLGYVTFRYKQEHWLLSTHTFPSSHLPSGQWHPSVQGELHLALSLLIFRHVSGQEDPHSLYSNPAGHCKAMRIKWPVLNVLWAHSVCVKLLYLALHLFPFVSLEGCYGVQSFKLFFDSWCLNLRKYMIW